MKQINADALRVALKGLYKEFKQIRDSSTGAARNVAEGQMLGVLKAVMKVNNAPAVEVDVREEWIPVEQARPHPFVSVLLHIPDAFPCPTVREGYMESDGTWCTFCYFAGDPEVAAWRPMPEPPEREEVLHGK